MNDFYTAKELAKELGVNVMTIYRYIHAGKIEAYKFSKEFRISKKVWRKFKKQMKFTRTATR